MRDDELELWREQWRGQPAVVIDLIRRVERETVQMRMGRLTLLVPAAVATVATVLVAMKPNTGGVLFVAGLWLFIAITAWLVKRNLRGVLTPAAETTAAYIELSIERCRRVKRGYRFGRVLGFLITAFVLFGVYAGLSAGGALKTTASYWILAATFLWTICVVEFAMFLQRRNVRKSQVELEYLLNLQRQLHAAQQGEP
jgi:hypothetical protein